MNSMLLSLAQAEPITEPDKSVVLVVLAALVVGIAVVGILMVVIVVIWGGRTRRISREGLPEVRTPDPFDVLRAETRRQDLRTDEGNAESDGEGPLDGEADLAGPDDED